MLLTLPRNELLCKLLGGIKLNYCNKVFFPYPFICQKHFIDEKVGNRKTKPTFIISVLKVEYQVVLVSLISNFLTDKTALANKWMSFSSSNVALGSNLARFRICKIRKDGRKRNQKIIYSGG